MARALNKQEEVGQTGLCPGSGSGELAIVGEGEFSTGLGLCGAVIVKHC